MFHRTSWWVLLVAILLGCGGDEPLPLGLLADVPAVATSVSGAFELPCTEPVAPGCDTVPTCKRWGFASYWFPPCPEGEPCPPPLPGDTICLEWA